MRARPAGRRAERLAGWLTPAVAETQAELAATGLRLDLVEIRWRERRVRPLPHAFAAPDLWRTLYAWLQRLLRLDETVTVTVCFGADGPSAQTRAWTGHVDPNQAA